MDSAPFEPFEPRPPTRDLKVVVYSGASHNFDDPSKTKQSVQANYDATQDAHKRAEAFFAEQLLR